MVVLSLAMTAVKKPFPNLVSPERVNLIFGDYPSFADGLAAAVRFMDIGRQEGMPVKFSADCGMMGTPTIIFESPQSLVWAFVDILREQEAKFCVALAEEDIVREGFGKPKERL